MKEGISRSEKMVLVFGSTGLEGHPKLTSIPMALALETLIFSSLHILLPLY